MIGGNETFRPKDHIFPPLTSAMPFSASKHTPNRAHSFPALLGLIESQ
jgi:hypothetical protein